MITKKQVYLQFGFMRKETIDKLFEIIENRPCCLSCQHYICKTGTQPDSLPFVKLECAEWGGDISLSPELVVGGFGCNHHSDLNLPDA